MRLLVIVALLALATPGWAQCKTEGSTSAAMVEALPEGAGADFNRAMAEATSPASVDRAVAAHAKAACKRTAQVRGENTDAFPRTWKGLGSAKAPLDIGFLAPITFKRDGKTVTWYAVVRSFGSGAVLLSGLIDGIPPDDRIEKILRGTYTGGFEPLEFDAATGKLEDKNVYLPRQLRSAAEADKRRAP